MPNSPPYFFLSYARSDDDAQVRKFYTDLCKEVRIRSGDPANAEIGFLDTSDIDLGAHWSTELTNALQRSRAFVALCSPLYFKSEYCGKEWALFAERVRQLRSQVPLVFPLVWLAGTPMHPAALELQQTTDQLGLRYREDGLRDYMRLGKHRDRRRNFISVLAEMIVKNVRRYDLPTFDYADIQTITSAWITKPDTPTATHSDRIDTHWSAFYERPNVLLDGVRRLPEQSRLRVLDYLQNRLLAESESQRLLPDLHIVRPILDGPNVAPPENAP